jgi:AcrR family transcriptional regulator
VSAAPEPDGKPARVRRRPGRPVDTDPALKRRILDAAFELVKQSPRERVALRAVAERADCDASLVGYYFGSRSGLMAAVAERAAEEFNAQLDFALRDGEVVERIRAVVDEPVNALAREHYLAQLFVDELIIHGDPGTDAVLQRMSAPFHARLREFIAEGRRTGELRDVDPDLLLYALAILPLLYHFLSPVYHRAFGETGVTRDSREFTDGLLDILLRGVLNHPATD